MNTKNIFLFLARVALCCFKQRCVLLCFRLSAKHHVIFTVSRIHRINTWFVLWMSHAIIISDTERKCSLRKIICMQKDVGTWCCQSGG